LKRCLRSIAAASPAPFHLLPDTILIIHLASSKYVPGVPKEMKGLVDPDLTTQLMMCLHYLAGACRMSELHTTPQSTHKHGGESTVLVGLKVRGLSSDRSGLIEDCGNCRGTVDYDLAWGMC